jgi:diadenosine tetraphosphate (Ap4A) HIT family hydrolase
MSDEEEAPDDLEAEEESIAEEDDEDTEAAPAAEVEEEAAEEEENEDGDEDDVCGPAGPPPPVVANALYRRAVLNGALPVAVTTPAVKPKRSPAKPRKASDWEIAQRRKDVLRLRMRGNTYREIATTLGIGVNTVKSDLREVQEENAQRVKGFRQDHFVGETMTVFDDVIQHAWIEYARVGPKDRLGALDLIRATANDRMKALMDVGLVHKAEQEVKHTHVHELPWSESVKQQVIQTMLNQALTPQALLPTPDPQHMPGKNIHEGEIVVTETPAPSAKEDARLAAQEDKVYRSLVSHGMSPQDARAAIDKGKEMAQEKMKGVVSEVVDHVMDDVERRKATH